MTAKRPRRGRRLPRLVLTAVAWCWINSAMPAPNLVVIVLDDLSVDAMQALLDGGWLPRISSDVVSAGVTFDNAFVTNPECCPSRATLLTGQYSHNHLVLANHDLNPLHGGIAWQGWLPSGEDPGRESSTIATWLQAAGYRTGFIGKYLNGYGEYAPAGYVDPRAYVPPGWDEWNGLLSPSLYHVYDYMMNDDGALVSYGHAEADYQTDVLSRRAVNFLTDALARPEPFFLVVAPLAPHVEVLDPRDPVTGNDPTGGFGLNIRPAARHAHLIDGNPENGEIADAVRKPSFNEADLSDKPSCPRALPGAEPQLVSEPFCVAERPALSTEDVDGLSFMYKSMLASVIAVDDLVGAIVDTITAGGQIDDTAILVTSDNGWFYGEHRLIGKELAYEESIRVPFVLRIPGGRAGTRSDAIVLNTDIASTLVDLAGAVAPYDPDGASVVPLAQEQPAGTWHGRKRFLVERWYIPSLLKFDGPTYLALRSIDDSADYTYIASRTDPDNFDTVTHRELYLHGTDPYQTDAIDPGPTIGSQLDDFLVLFRACRGAVCRILESF